MAQVRYVIGIDFGSSQSSIAVLRIGSTDTPELLNVGGGRNGVTIPTLLAVDANDGSVIDFGANVRKHYSEEQQGTVIFASNFKRYLGANVVSDSPDSRKDANKYCKLFIYELAKFVKERYNVKELDPNDFETCIAYPATWANEKGKVDLLKQYVEEAGFPADPIFGIKAIPEPVAAMHALKLQNADFCFAPYPAYYMVIDFGGGTLDICVIRTDTLGRTPEIISTSGDSELGGKEFDDIEIVKKEEQISNNQLHDKLKQWEKNDVYVTCFSRDGDNLYQWRCYTPPQGGVSLGFSREELQQKIFGNDSTNLGTMGNTALKMFSFSSSTPSNTSEKDALGCLGSCLYYETEQNKAITDFISLEKKNHSLNAFFLACLMKHKSFEFEKEERIVYVGPSCFDKIEMIGNKPRIPLLGASKDESRQLIKGVIVAPHGDSEHNFYLTHLWARKYHLDWEPSFSCSTYVGG